MKWWTIKIMLIPLFISANIQAQDGYERKIDKYQNAWLKLIPRYSKLQFAGGIGMFSGGMGWDYGKHKCWETDLLLGYIPSFSHEGDNKLSFTVKQNYLPWNIGLGKGWSLQPLTCGAYINTVFDDDFWAKEPKRYPSSYYKFSTKVRSHVFLGQRITLSDKQNSNRSVSLYYEFSTCDLYLVSAFSNKYIRPKDILSLSFGVKVQFL